ncbi:hypothetical protein C4559_01775 [Candidatus Microgenomates bacterium]|nr:MAG: hypothetical protein C4559_01775 [Candidatus Microgenomates bacterium]
MFKKLLSVGLFTSIFLLLASTNFTYAGGGPVEFSLEPNTSLNPGEQYIVHARVYADGPYPTYCKNCYIKLGFKNPQEGDYIVQNSDATNEEGRIYAKAISKVTGERIIIVTDLKDSNGKKIDAGSSVALKYTGESIFLKTPTNLRITQVETTTDPNIRKVHILWDPVPGATSYTVYKPMGGINYYHTAVDTNLYEMDVNISSVFYIAVSARKDGMESARSQVLTIDLANIKTDTVGNPITPSLSASSISINAWILNQQTSDASNRQVTVKWGAFDGNPGTFTIYGRLTSNKNNWDKLLENQKGPSAGVTIPADKDYYLKVSGCKDKIGTCADSNVLLLPKFQEQDGNIIIQNPSTVSNEDSKVKELNNKVENLQNQLDQSKKNQFVLEQRINDLVNFIKKLFPFFK